MNTVACPACNFANANVTANSVCSQCGVSLAPALIQQSIDEINKLTQRMKQSQKPEKSFTSFNGFGTTLLDYRALPDGTYEATRWIIAMALPIAPLATYRIQPTSREISYGQETNRFTILDKTRLAPARVLRTYLLTVVGLAPVVIGFIYSREINRAMSGPKAFGLMLLCIAWAFYIIFFKLKNEGQAYKQTAPAAQS